jgi:dihydroxyacetone kinase
LWKNAGNTCLIEVNTCLNMFGATLTLLRAGIAEGLRIFEMPCQWTFNM